VPARLIFEGLPLALWVSEIVALFPPELDGLKEILIEQVALGAILAAVQVCEPGNCVVSVLVTELTISEAVPVFRTVIIWTVLVALIVWEPKFILVGEIEITGLATPTAMPVPTRLYVVGLPLTLWAIEIEALLLPVLVGVNVTLIVQLLPAATLVQLFDWANWFASLPVRVTPLIVSVAVPVLLTLIDCAELVVLTVW